jgi:hypothetical protein
MAQANYYTDDTEDTDPYGTQTQTPKATQAQPTYQKVATAPDGVPVYASGGNFFTQNPDQSYTQQFAGGAPDWLKQQTGAAPTPAPTAQYLQSLIASGLSPQDAVARFNSETGRQTGNQAVYYNDSRGQTIGLPEGYLTVADNWASLTPHSEGGGGGGGDTGMSALLAYLQQQQAGNATQKAADQAKADDLYKTLQARATQATTVNPNDPVIKAQTDAYNAQTDRASRNYLADLAERSGPLANLQGQQRITAEHAGQAGAAFQANLLGTDLSNKRAEIADALHSMGGLLSAAQQNDLQAQLGNLDALIKQQGLVQQQNQFGQTLAFQQSGQAQQLQEYLRQLGLQQDQQNNYWKALYSGVLT